MSYAELQVTSNFSFLMGASHPEELVETAHALGHDAIAVADRNTLAGVVRFHGAAVDIGMRLIVGARLDFIDGPGVLCFPEDKSAYARLSRMLSTGKRRAEKGHCHLYINDLLDHAEGQVIVALTPDRANGGVDDKFTDHLTKLREVFGGRLYLAVQHLARGDDGARIRALGLLADAMDIPLVAAGDVLYHTPARRPLQDVLTCIREGCTIHQAGARLNANAERHLKSAGEMKRLFQDRPDAISNIKTIVERCRFSLDELKYEYPSEPVPDGSTAQEELARLTWIGAANRYPDGIPGKVRYNIEHELNLIGKLNYAPYFLTVDDIVRFARSRGILCQGRGSAANSAVCYCLGITSVDPSVMDLLFERFVSAARNEPPDIDVDFEHERREEVIQYIYGKYGRERAALTAEVICYRSRSAVREVGKVMGMSMDTVDALSRASRWERGGIKEDNIREIGLDPSDRTLKQVIILSRQLSGFPRHLSQHVGGFVISEQPLHDIVPIENARMEDRTVIEWDKDDLDRLGILKIDVLGLGMLTCIRKAFDLIERHYGASFDLATIPQEDPAVYDMLCEADSIGVFQVESRAQMSMLPRLKPRVFYDLVIEVAIVRPGPIQGDMVHPYLRRRNGEEKVSFPSRELEQVLGKTLGVPLFQEQAMKIAIVAAGFTPEDADRLRRAMATFKRTGTINNFRDKMIRGMVRNGYDEDFAERCFKQIEGFGDYGFPESHAASFALLVYVSAWLKKHYPAAFACAILNAQPMGFYAPAQLVRDARDHGVEVRALDVNHSDWDCTLEDARAGRALRLGFRQAKGMREADVARLLAARDDGYQTVRDAWRRANLDRRALETMARADAWGSLGLDRRAALWQVRGLGETPLPLFAFAETQTRPGSNAPPPEWGIEPDVDLPALGIGEEVMADYRHLRLSLRKHPCALLRDELAADGIVPNEKLSDMKDGAWVAVSGLVVVRQRPGTACGVIFATLEDETGVANVIVWPAIFERYRRDLLESRLLRVAGTLQKEGRVIHVVARHLLGLNDYLRTLATPPDVLEERSLKTFDQSHDIPDGRNFR
ncbi:MAG: error-prone DNA polymerase [Rhodospirillales bacterium]|nr:error-prone DNA polymerase [Rhodospirillales bacterium]